jgi:hypothetical protein
MVQLLTHTVNPFRICDSCRNLDREIDTAVDHDLPSLAVININATSTCDCRLRVGFARECVRMLVHAKAKSPPKQRLVT